MSSKQCTKCKETKPLIEFGNSKSTTDKKTYWCLECKREHARKHRDTPEGRYQQLKGQINFTQKHKGDRDHRGYIRSVRKDLLYTQDEFLAWYELHELKCAYCDLPEEYISVLDDSVMRRSKHLTLDCKDNEIGYTIDNIVWSCPRCNFMKSDFLGFHAMRDIGQRHIKPVWERLLGIEFQ